jgi:predicted transcriptional regulator of viral defense system
LESNHVLEDPWILVPALFEPAYIGGWSAAEYWDLTEQIFRDIVVMTVGPLRERKKNVHGVSFILRHIPGKHFFGTRTVWRGRSKVSVADPHRTIVDMLREPSLGGGIQHFEDCFIRYLRREDRDLALLVEYADKLVNGAIFKRLGFLAERQRIDLLVQLCRERLTTGNAKLDNRLKCPKLITRWRLFVPETWLDDKP